MSISLYEEPPRITISQPDVAGGSRNGLLLGFTVDEEGFHGIVCLEDGSVTHLDTWTFSIDYRYDAQSDRWVDKDAHNASEPEQQG